MPNSACIDSAKQKKMLEENPELSLKYSKMVEAELNKRFHFMIKGTPEATQVRQVRMTPLLGCGDLTHQW
jgi:hypothetical protein